MISCKRLPLIFLLIFILPFVLLSFQAVESPAYSHLQKTVKYDINSLEMFNDDPAMNLLGKSFEEIIQVLGEPDEQGYSEWLGPHHYILFQHEKGIVRFCSPESIEKKIAVSIILGPGQEVLGAKVGLVFAEIIDVLGAPDLGPELGMDNLYYMDYFFGDINHQTPAVFISFSALDVNSPTRDVYIKWEAFEYDQEEKLQTVVLN